MFDYTAEMKIIENMTYQARTVDTSVFDELLDRDVSDDTKALIEAQREVYISQYAIVDMVEFRGQQSFMAILATQNQLASSFDKIDQKQTEIIDHLKNNSDHLEKNELRGDQLNDLLLDINGSLVSSADKISDFEASFQNEMAKTHDFNERLGEGIISIRENTYVSEEKEAIEMYALLAIIVVIVFAVPVILTARTIWFFYKNVILSVF
ncbi:hypothetical protein IGI86_001637 [Enterococcus sp. AZ188]|uniref:hypothetical protein n=1 Tax=unclassified Enterococcus TaxID=2608891 RepID=UPI003D27A9A8